MAQMLLVDSFANARRHERASDPPRVLLQCHYDRLRGSRLDDFVLSEWNLFTQLMMNKDSITKEGLGKNGYHLVQLPRLALHVPLLGKSSPTVTLSHS